MKTILRLLIILLIATAAARAQVVPAATGPSGLPIHGLLRYNLHYSEYSQIDGPNKNYNNQQASLFSGDATYSNTSTRRPFSMQYGGGYSWTWIGPPQASGVFQHLALSQGFIHRSWSLSVSDGTSYTFETPTTTYSGVAGTGEPVTGSGSTTPSSQTILVLNNRTVENDANVGLGRTLTRATALNFGGGSSLLYFLDGNGQNTTTWSANVGGSHRLDEYSSMNCSYGYSRYSYDDAPATQIQFIQSNTIQLGVSRLWKNKISAYASFGPQWLSSSNSTLIPNSTGISASASVSDTFKIGSASLSYNHGLSSGSGYMLGAESDTASASFGRSFGRLVNFGMSTTYSRSAQLNSSYVSTGITGAAQATRKLGRYFSLFAGYSAFDQSTNLSASTGALNSLSQGVSFGIGYSPRPIRIRP